MADMTFEASGLKKSYNRRVIFSDVNINLKNMSSLAIVGRNGSGKSTLVKILAGLLSPTKGEVNVTINGKKIDPSDLFQYIGFVSPYLQMYDEFSGLENLEIVSRVRNLGIGNEYAIELLKKVNLEQRANDAVRTYSSGMKQRLKYVFALLHRPPILMLDEPSSNLDAEGIASIYQIIEEQKKHGIMIIATNDADEQKMCEHIIDLNTKVQSTGART